MENSKKEVGVDYKQQLEQLLETEKEKRANALAQIDDITKQRIKLFGELGITEYDKRFAIDRALTENKEELDQAIASLERLNTELEEKLKSLRLVKESDSR